MITRLMIGAASAALLASCAHTPSVQAPSVQARAKPLITVDGLKFKDSNGNGKLDAYEDWRRPVDARVADIQAVMKEIGTDKVVLSINFRQPYVIDEASGFKQAGAIVAGFGVGNAALLDVLSGRSKPQGRLPFALANNLQAVIDNQPDAPGYPAKDTLYPFGFGLSY
jgi:Glycosyl hydrolase family 3 C-terminal domain